MSLSPINQLRRFHHVINPDKVFGTHKARKEADRPACDAWNKRMLGYRGPAQPSPTLGDALNAGYLYLEVRCLGCDGAQAEDNTDPRA
jgi:hypothetical protein